jgi:hypothetical protein
VKNTKLQGHHLAGAAMLAFLGGCAGKPPLTDGQPLAYSPEGPAIKYRLSAKNLADKFMWKSEPVFADVNGDGLLDLAAHPRLGDGAHVWLGDGKGGWTEASQGLSMEMTCGGGLEVGDVNNDKKLDIAVGDHCEGVYVFLGDGSGHWKKVTDAMNPALSRKMEEEKADLDPYSGSEDLALGDVNEDGFLDIVASGTDEAGFTVYFGDGTGKNWKEAPANGLPKAHIAPSGDPTHAGWANDVQLEDMNGDGHVDVAAAFFAGPMIWLGDGKGNWEHKSVGLPMPPMGGIFRKIAVADINGDGRKDMAASNVVNGPQVFLQNADGTWQAFLDVMPDLRAGAESVALGDLDQDGHVDLLVGGVLSEDLSSGYGLYLLRGDGKGGWTPTQSSLPVSGLDTAWGIAVGDVNRDGRPDLAINLTGKVGIVSRKGMGIGQKAQADKNSGKAKAGQTPAIDAEPVVQVWLGEK